MKWINIKDELPKDNTNCIIWYDEKEGNDIFGYFIRVIFYKNYNGKNNRFILSENADEYHTDYTDSVTHWMIPTNPNV